MKKYLIFSIVFVLVSCDTVKQLRLEADADAKISNNTHHIPFKYKKDLIIVHAQLQGNVSKNTFIFDTGAFNSKVEYNLAETLQLKTASKQSNGTAQGIRRTIEMTVVDSVRFDDLLFYGIAAGKLKYDAKSYSPCVAPDGIIGANLIKLANWKIDYQRKELVVSQEGFEFDENLPKHTVNFYTSFLSGIPKIDIEIEGVLIENVLFDLGYNGGLVIPEKYASKFSNSASRTFIDQSTSGIYGSNRDTLIVKDLNVTISDFNAKIPVQFSSLNKALLGNDFLEHFTVFLDYTNEKIILQPTQSVHIAKEKPFIPGILNDSLWIVNRCISDRNVQIGDTLRSINGFKPKDIFTSHCDYFLNLTTFLQKDTLVLEKKIVKKFNLLWNK
ncbi:retropepsin-like domain-containing protein [Kordia sp. YSTF-M3]|uniref:Retropepsin-like domain-containing protein n=1 Tax=Kordia aestuariivivens TaxID=2759037 RepID=A0ABR7Q9R5_9FLAO|nr:aspartyl protease family protein [Kordia aestuariivivens]MBC8755309.1 retropepsin-like domain-containing protein [Kordia aestuariivivens]